MKVYVVKKAGGPSALEWVELHDPIAKPGQALIRIKAFGLNRAEAITRMGGSGDLVPFPRVIGIECVGEVVDCPDGTLQKGQKVACAMGEMGRQYDGSYAEMTVVPLSNVFPVKTNLSWTEFAAIPETYFTAWGCCFSDTGLRLAKAPARVLITPGASALGIAVTQIINDLGGEVIGVTRSPHKVDRLLETGMKHVIVSKGSIVEELRSIWPEGADGIIDTIVSETTLHDAYQCRSESGRICIAGSLAESYGTDPTGNTKSAFQEDFVGYYDSGTISVEKNGKDLQFMVEQVERGKYQSFTDRIFPFSELQKAHVLMEENAFAGKVVIQVATE